MTNAEKFKEVFDFELNTKTDYYCPFNSTKCDNLPCDACIEKFWQSEYEEPKEERINIAERIKLVNNTVEKTTAKWEEAIGKIKADINDGINETASLIEVAKATTNFFAEEELGRLKNILNNVQGVIDKHTKELMKGAN